MTLYLQIETESSNHLLYDQGASRVCDSNLNSTGIEQRDKTRHLAGFRRCVIGYDKPECIVWAACDGATSTAY
jgi:hypothetical protein